MKYLLIIFISFEFIGSCNAQSNDTEAALYNVGFGAIFGTVGAIINKEKAEPLGKVIKKSLWQGALGGYITFESKRILRESARQEQWEYFWVAKVVNAAGTSIKENAALNNDFWERWHINIGFNRLEFHTKEKFTIKYKLMPYTFGYVVDAFFRYDFKFKESLRVGDFIFSTNTEFNNNNFINVDAISRPGHIVYETNFIDDIELQAHEVVHQYQSNDFSIFNTYLNKPVTNWSKKNKTVSFLYKHLYLEYHYLILSPLYVLESKNANNYYDNFFEHEAEYFSSGFD